MKYIAVLCTTITLIASPLSNAASSNDSDFPSSCEMGNGSVQERHKEKYERFALGTLHSMADSCAFGERIQSMIDGAMSEIFGSLSDLLDFADEDFFCGFGTRDVWQVGTEGTGAEGTSSFRHYRNSMFGQARSEVRDYTREWSDSRRRDFDEGSENVLESIFNPSNSDDENSEDGGNGIW